MISNARSMALGLCAVIAAAGCTEVVPTAEFKGPWADDFEHSYATSDSEYVRAILEDEVITDQEYAETIARYRVCMTAAGLTVETYQPGGGGSFSFPPEMGADAAYAESEACSATSGERWVSMLYGAVRRNPEHLSELSILIQCFVDAGIVEAGYSREDYDRDARSGPTFPFKNPEHDKPLFDACTADPLGILQ